MRIFHAELVVQPALYSFGYSTYAYLEPGDDLSSCYEQGFLPFVGVRDEAEPMLYMARGVRVLAEQFNERTYHHRVDTLIRKQYGNELRITEFLKSDFHIDADFEAFLLSFFHARFGKDSMSSDRIRAILASPLLTHIVEYRSGKDLLGYTLETHGSNFIHLWYIAYDSSKQGTHLGAYQFLDVVRRAKSRGASYAYLGVTCGIHMKFKTLIQPLEYWDGNQWVHDPKSIQLKKILDTDAVRSLAMTDAWRDARHPYYEGLVKFDSARAEFRFLILSLFGLPRVSRILILCVACIALLFLANQTTQLISSIRG